MRPFSLRWLFSRNMLAVVAAALLTILIRPAANLNALVWPTGHPPTALSATWTASTTDATFNIYVWREGGHVWIEIEPLSGYPFICGPEFTIVQDNQQLIDVVVFALSELQYQCSILYVPTVVLLARLIASDECGSYYCLVDYLNNTRTFTLYYYDGQKTYKMEVPAETTSTLAYVDPYGSCGGNSPCYTSIQDAVEAESSGSVIRIAQGSCDEDLILGDAKDLTLQGGWDSSFTTRSSSTIISSITISNSQGTVTVEYLVIQ